MSLSMTCSDHRTPTTGYSPTSLTCSSESRLSLENFHSVAFARVLARPWMCCQVDFKPDPTRLRGSSSPNNQAMAGCQRNGAGSGGRGGSVSNVSRSGMAFGYCVAAAGPLRAFHFGEYPTCWRTEVSATPFLGTIRDKKPSLFFAKTNRLKNRKSEESPIKTQVWRIFAKFGEAVFSGSNPAAPVWLSAFSSNPF